MAHAYDDDDDFDRPLDQRAYEEDDFEVDLQRDALASLTRTTAAALPEHGETSKLSSFHGGPLAQDLKNRVPMKETMATRLRREKIAADREKARLADTTKLKSFLSQKQFVSKAEARKKRELHSALETDPKKWTGKKLLSQTAPFFILLGPHKKCIFLSRRGHLTSLR